MLFNVIRVYLYHPPSPPSNVDCVEARLECITSTLHQGDRGEKMCHFDELLH